MVEKLGVSQTYRVHVSQKCKSTPSAARFAKHLLGEGLVFGIQKGVREADAVSKCLFCSIWKWSCPRILGFLQDDKRSCYLPQHDVSQKRKFGQLPCPVLCTWEEMLWQSGLLHSLQEFCLCIDHKVWLGWIECLPRPSSTTGCCPEGNCSSKLNQ